jgi:hypothetical protein
MTLTSPLTSRNAGQHLEAATGIDLHFIHSLDATRFGRYGECPLCRIEWEEVS